MRDVFSVVVFLLVCVSPMLSLHHVHGVFGEERVDVGEGRAELAVSVPAAQHELVETLRTHSRPAQIHLQERERERRGEKLMKVEVEEEFLTPT